MSDRNEDQSDENTLERNETETILMALDQISQTIDVMTSVVGRLRHYVQEHEVASEADLRDAMHPDRTLH
jgi:C4-dicarboxylate-specific signal transduction histidine kinase